MALLTPFSATGELDLTRLGTHARRVLTKGVHGITLFGTTGEGASIGRSERKAAISSVLADGWRPERVVAGICATSVEHALEQISDATLQGVTQFLLLPPFYFKGCTDDGLLAWHAEILARSDPRTRFILYHIPQVSGVPLSIDLVGRLAALGEGRIFAIKDSSGDWENTQRLLDQKSLSVLVGDERLLHKALRLGAAGSICGTANLYPERLVRVFETAEEDTRLSEEVTRIVSEPVVPALKVLLAHSRNEPAWERVRPPLTELPADARTALVDMLGAPA